MPRDPNDQYLVTIETTDNRYIRYIFSGTSMVDIVKQITEFPVIFSISEARIVSLSFRRFSLPVGTGFVRVS